MLDCQLTQLQALMLSGNYRMLYVYIDLDQEPR